MNLLNALKGIGKVATVVSGANPAIAGITAAVEVISQLSDKDEEKRTQLYVELAADMCEISAAILRALKDGEITSDEHAAIVKELKDLLPGRD